MLNLKGLRKSDKKFLLWLNDWTELRSDWNMLLRLSAGWKLSARPHFSPRPTWQDEEDAGNEGQDGALRPDVPDVTDDEGGEDEEQRDHWEGRGRPHHFCRSERRKSDMG